MTFFEARRTSEGEVFIPLPDAASRWTGTHVRGPAITSLLARAIEQVLPSEVDLLPARSTFDLHGQVPMAPCRTRARVVRQGRTLWIVESELYAGGVGADRPLARCRAALVAPIAEDAALSEEPPASVWAAPLAPECTPPPPEMQAVSARGRLYRSRATEWTGDRAAHQDAHRNLVWYYDEPIIAGEAPTPYQLAARVSDLGNYVINYGAEGLSHINTDATLALARLPEPGGIGLAGELRVAHAGVSTGTAILFDAAGMCGTSTVTAVQHTKTRLTYR